MTGLDVLPLLGGDVFALLLDLVDDAVEAFADLTLGLAAQLWGDDEPGDDAGRCAGEKRDRELPESECALVVEHVRPPPQIRSHPPPRCDDADRPEETD